MGRKWFGEDVSKLLNGTYWQQFDMMLEALFTNKVTIKFDVFCSFMENRIRQCGWLHHCHNIWQQQVMGT